MDAFRLRPSLGERLIKSHGLELEDVGPESFIEVQRWLNALKDLRETVGPNVLHRVGMAMLKLAEFPPQFDKLDMVLENLDAIYYANHKGDVGHYFTSKRSDGSWEVRCETPYPREFERGATEGLVQRPMFTKDGTYRVEFTDGPPDSDVTCTMVVRAR
ncbi:MAG: hypothetical protein JKY37_21330 [Nannocystaceae bacterium]|nr:hypothetical protein [Nannocystaceae bacterium]